MSDSPVLPGRAADAPGNAAGPAPGRFRTRPDPVRIAVGTPAPGEVVDGAGAITHHLNYQQVAPSAAAVITSTADRPGPMADAVTGHNAMARVQQMDQARASNAGLAPQLAERMPSPVPGQPPEHIAATDRGAPPHGVAPRWPGVYSREPKPS